MTAGGLARKTSRTENRLGAYFPLGRRLSTTEGSRGVGCCIGESHVLPDELHGREAGREHEGDRGQRDGELRRHAAPIPVTRP